MTFITVQEAQAQLSDLIQRLLPGQELHITRSRPDRRQADPDRPALAGATDRLGTFKGTDLYMAADFDEPLDDFKEYME